MMPPALWYGCVPEALVMKSTITWAGRRGGNKRAKENSCIGVRPGARRAHPLAGRGRNPGPVPGSAGNHLRNKFGSQISARTGMRPIRTKEFVGVWVVKLGEVRGA